MADLDTIINDVQTALYNLLSTDTTSITTTSPAGESVSTKLSDFKWCDGDPKEILQGTAKIYCIVHTPEISMDRHTLSKHKVTITTTIEVVSRREKNVRLISDMIKKVLNDNDKTSSFIGAKIVLLGISNTNLTSTRVSDKDVVYTYQIIVRHSFYGS